MWLSRPLLLAFVYMSGMVYGNSGKTHCNAVFRKTPSSFEENTHGLSVRRRARWFDRGRSSYGRLNIRRFLPQIFPRAKHKHIILDSGVLSWNSSSTQSSAQCFKYSQCTPLKEVAVKEHSSGVRLNERRLSVSPKQLDALIAAFALMIVYEIRRGFAPPRRLQTELTRFPTAHSDDTMQPQPIIKERRGWKGANGSTFYSLSFFKHWAEDAMGASNASGSNQDEFRKCSTPVSFPIKSVETAKVLVNQFCQKDRGDEPGLCGRHIPCIEDVSAFLRVLQRVTRHSHECFIIAIVYLSRVFVPPSNVMLTCDNWKPILFSAILVAHKYWEFARSSNAKFVLGYPPHNVKDADALEQCFLTFLEHNTTVSPLTYAQCYYGCSLAKACYRRAFLRTVVQPLRPADSHVCQNCSDVAFMGRNAVGNKSEGTVKRFKGVDFNGSSTPSNMSERFPVPCHDGGDCLSCITRQDRLLRDFVYKLFQLLKVPAKAKHSEHNLHGANKPPEFSRASWWLMPSCSNVKGESFMSLYDSCPSQNDAELSVQLGHFTETTRSLSTTPFEASEDVGLAYGEHRFGDEHCDATTPSSFSGGTNREQVVFPCLCSLTDPRCAESLIVLAGSRRCRVCDFPCRKRRTTRVSANPILPAASPFNAGCSSLSESHCKEHNAAFLSSQIQNVERHNVLPLWEKLKLLDRGDFPVFSWQASYGWDPVRSSAAASDRRTRQGRSQDNGLRSGRRSSKSISLLRCPTTFDFSTQLSSDKQLSGNRVLPKHRRQSSLVFPVDEKPSCRLTETYIIDSLSPSGGDALAELRSVGQRDRSASAECVSACGSGTL